MEIFGKSQIQTITRELHTDAFRPGSFGNQCQTTNVFNKRHHWKKMNINYQASLTVNRMTSSAWTIRSKAEFVRTVPLGTVRFYCIPINGNGPVWVKQLLTAE